MKKMTKKAEMGMMAKPKVKVTATVTKKPAPSPKKTYPILPDEGDNYDQTMKREAEMKKKGIFKMGGAVKKAKNGTAFGMLSVKAGIDKNPNPTAADRIAGATGKAKMGKSMKKAMMGTGMHKMPDGSMMKKSMMKSGGAMEKCRMGCK